MQVISFISENGYPTTFPAPLFPIALHFSEA